MTEVREKIPGAIPVWLGIILILIALLIGGWITRSLMNRSTNKTGGRVVVGDEVPSGRRPEGLIKHGSGHFSGRADDIYLQADRSRQENQSYDISLGFTHSWLTSHQRDLSVLATKIVNSSLLAKHIELTAEQRQRLTSLETSVRLSSDERAKLDSATKAWDKASSTAKADANNAAIQAMLDIGGTHREKNKLAMTKRVTEIPKILSPQQIRKAQDWNPPAFSWGTPTTRPTTRPNWRTWQSSTQPTTRSTTRPTTRPTMPAIRPTTRPTTQPATQPVIVKLPSTQPATQPLK